MIFIGIDLAWTYKNETGICVIDEVGNIKYIDSKVFSDQEIVDIIKEYKDNPICLAIDAPLVVNNEGGSRSAERDFMKSKINGHHLRLFAASRGFITRTYGSIRGERLMNLIISDMNNFAIKPYTNSQQSIIVETFPTGICAGIFSDIYPVKYKVKAKIPYEETKYQFQRLIDRISYAEEVENHISGIVEKLDIKNIDISKKNHKHIEDKVDAFLCAFGMYMISTSSASQKVFGDTKKGFICIPVIELE